jgi:hypothetical protein
MTRNSVGRTVALGCLLLLAAVAGSWADAPQEIGKVHRESEPDGGQIRADGRMLLDGELVRTELTQAIVHLRNGEVLKIEPNSAARFEAASFDKISVRVFSGRVIKWSVKGKPLVAGAGSRFTVGRSMQDPLVVERELLRSEYPVREEERERDLGRRR